MIKLIAFIIFALFTAGVVIALDIKFEDILDLFRGRKEERTLGDFVAVYNPPKGKKKGFKKDTSEIKEILAVTGQSEKFAKIKMAALAFAIIGFLVCVLAKSYFMAPVAMVGCGLVPFIYIKHVCNRYQKSIDESIEATLSIITNSYLRTENIVTAVKENIPYIQTPLKAHFERFILEVETINPNVTIALNNLKYKVSNPVFFDWCNRLIQCQSDRTLKNTLLPIIEKMSDLRSLRATLAAELIGPRNEAIVMGGLILMNFPLLYFINKDWFAVLTDTTPGKIAVALIFFIMLIGYFAIWRLNQPLKYEDLEEL